jgi:hypothetical protein
VWFSKSEKRKHKRCEVPLGISDVRVARRSASVCRGQLVDLSANGAKLNLDALLTYGEIIVPLLDVSTAFTATVAWSKQTASRHYWLAGCSFNEELPPEVVERLATGGAIDRRTDPRIPATMPVMAQWQMMDDFLPGTIRDFSNGGFCLECAGSYPIGTKVHLKLESGQFVVGIVRWMAQRDDQRLYGCQFAESTRSRDADAIRRMSDLSASRFWSEA